MQIKRLVIENFKSIERIELVEPNPFTVFVGPNGSGKSNIFEALEFWNLSAKTERGTVESLFGGQGSYTNRNHPDWAVQVKFEMSGASEHRLVQRPSLKGEQEYTVTGSTWGNRNAEEDRQLLGGFSRIFVRNERLLKLVRNDDQSLSLSASNLEKVLKRVLSNETLKNEIFEWLELFVPGFKAVEVDDRNELHWFEKDSPNYFTKDLISDGTYNILALLTAVYQSDDKPQFLCIEEPENGLHPQVAGELVDFFRIMCEERGHYIWLNTHSQTMASRVRPEEFVVVDKKNGATQVQQFRKEDFYGMRADEAWLTNSLNGGLAW
ncbi:MAG: AAA family ATPase [Rudanella sp.]|nr:AAA family ATPase [Rudanella sp.]